MNKKIKFNKSRILFGLLFITLMLFSSIYFLVNPKIFLRNKLMKIEHIQIIGILGIIYFPILIFSLLNNLKKKYAIVITNDFLIDNSKYEAFGKIKWKDITKIQRKKKRSIEIFVKKDLLKNRKMNFIKRFLNLMHNWNYNDSIIISSTLTEYNIDNLYEMIMKTYENNK